MPDRTAAERQRRYRAHKAGDHSLCDPERDCRTGQAVVTPPVTTPVTQHGVTPPPSGLSTRGRRLWRDTVDSGPLNGRDLVLLEEACRLADRLDKLDRILNGDEDSWLRFHALNDDGSIVRVVVNGALAEARQQQVALKQLLSELRQSRAPGKPAGQPVTPQAGKGVAGVLDLTARIAALRGDTSTG